MSRSFSVLLVEDDDPLRSVLTDLLSQWGWTVHDTGLGQEAVAIARRIPLDFSILDMHLPGMTGVDVLLRIAQETRPLPSIFMSGQATPEEANAALRAGAFTLLRKPLDLAGLRTTVHLLIQRHFGTAGFGPVPGLPPRGLLPPPPGHAGPGSPPKPKRS